MKSMTFETDEIHLRPLTTHLRPPTITYDHLQPPTHHYNHLVEVTVEIDKSKVAHQGGEGSGSTSHFGGEGRSTSHFGEAGECHFGEAGVLVAIDNRRLACLDDGRKLWPRAKSLRNPRLVSLLFLQWKTLMENNLRTSQCWKNPNWPR